GTVHHRVPGMPWWLGRRQGSVSSGDARPQTVRCGNDGEAPVMSGQTIILAGASQRASAKRLIDAAPAYAVVNIRVAKGTTEQNALMWCLSSDLRRAKLEGDKISPQVWRCRVMHACGHAVKIEIGLNGSLFPVGFRSSKLTVALMADLIIWILQY